MFICTLRTIILYILLVLGMRMMGKRQVGQLQPSEFVTTILLSELITAPILDSDIPLLGAVIPFLLVICFEIIIPWFVARYPTAKRIVDGRPCLLILNGEIDQKTLLSMRMSVDELLGQLRIKGVGNVQDVQYGILEQNGQISIFSKTEAPLSHPVVIDGTLNHELLKKIGKNTHWLYKIMAEKNIRDMHEIFLLSVTDNDTVTFITQKQTE